MILNSSFILLRSSFPVPATLGQSNNGHSVCLRGNGPASVLPLHIRRQTSINSENRHRHARRRLKEAKSPDDAQSSCAELERLLRAEMGLARRLHAIQSNDSHIGFEASNQYYYVPVDLAEKVINCQDLLTRWLPAERSR
jgi:hypothetical protein